MSANPFDVVLTPIKEARCWTSAPAEAKEFILLFSGGLIRRIALITKNEFVEGILDSAIKDDVTYAAVRSMRVLELAEDGSHAKIYVSIANDIHNDLMWYPKRLFKSAVDAAGYVPAAAMVGGGDEVLITKCGKESWRRIGIWYAKVLKHFITTEGYQMIFSHYHNIDAQGHMLVKWLKGDAVVGSSALKPDKINELLENVYEQTDEYIGQYLDMLDDG